MKKTAKKPYLQTQKGVTRRELIKSTGTTALAVSAGAGLGFLGGRAPAFAQGSSVHVLAWNHYIKEADALMRNELIPEFKRASGISVRYETISGSDLNGRAKAAMKSDEGPDIFQFLFNMPHLYAKGLVNHDVLASKVGVEAHYDFHKEAVKVDGVMRGIPYYSVSAAHAYRKDIFAKLSIKKPPETWEEYLKIGKKLKDFGMPVGQTLGHDFADATGFSYPLLWSFGGQEVDEKGKVAINSRATLSACEFLREFWSAACDEAGLAWDGASNNRAFFAETIGATLNGASIYFVARNNPEKVPPGLADNIGHFINPQGPNGRFTFNLSLTHSIARYSKNQSAAAEFIRFLMGSDVYERYILVQKGYGQGSTPEWEKHSFWKLDPILEPFRFNPKYGRNFGWAGPYNGKVTVAWAKFIIVDLFARVAKGESPQSSIVQAERELKKVYEGA